MLVCTALSASNVVVTALMRSRLIFDGNPRANGAKRHSGRKPGARVTNPALAKFRVAVYGS